MAEMQETYITPAVERLPYHSYTIQELWAQENVALTA
jgi:hypothetical protein